METQRNGVTIRRQSKGEIHMTLNNAVAAIILGCLCAQGFSLVPRVSTRYTFKSRRLTRNLVIGRFQPSVDSVAGTVVGTGILLGVARWFLSANDRALRNKWREFELKQEIQLRESAQEAFVPYKEVWDLSEIALHDGSNERGPILIAVDGLVFNCWKGRQFYGQGREYNIFAGKDATRLLAKGLLADEPFEERVSLSLSERASLAGWIMKFKLKYSIVGNMEGAGESLVADLVPSTPLFLNSFSGEPQLKNKDLGS
jgi:membrane-associated progesterone receptor component